MIKCFRKQGSQVISDVLLAVKVSLVDLDKCRKMYDEVAVFLPNGTICAGHEKGGKDACEVCIL